MSANDLLKINIMAQTIFDAENKMMSSKECAEFLDCCTRTVLKRLKLPKNNKNRIISKRIGTDHKIPKIQFLNELIEQYKHAEIISKH